MRHSYGNKAKFMFCLLVFFVLNASVCYAQKFTFTHYDIEDGLIQSQTNGMALDQEHRLWIATFGGVCRFDGKEFISYTRQNGMPTNFVNCVFTDRNDGIWFGTQDGLAKLANKKLVNLKLPGNPDNRRVRNIVQDADGNVWSTVGGRLFKVNGNSIKQLWVQDTIRRLITCIAVDRSGRLFASVYRKGLYYLENGKWVNMVSYPANDNSFFVAGILFDRTDKNKIYIQTYTSVYTINDGKLLPFENAAISSIKGYLLCFIQDTDNNFWIGTTSGAYFLKNGRLIHFMASNGLTDNAVTYIYNDADNNLWLASQGSGLYKYEGDRYTMLDRSQGMPYNEVVMGITKDKKGDILVGIDGGGLMRYVGKKLIAVNLPEKDPGIERIEYLYTDSKGVVWIGTHEGLWSYDNNTVKPIKELNNYAINGITEDSKGVIWITTPSGCFYIENNEAKHVANYYRYSSAVISLGHDSIMVGTNDGIGLVVNKEIVNGFKLNALRTSAVFCMLKYHDNVIFGTDDRGIFVWNRTTGIIKNYSLKDGLNSNAVYSLVTDDHGVIWAGTGRGVNQVLFDEQKNAFSITGNEGPKSLILETNQNATFYADHKVWIGTTKGAVIYDVNSVKTHSSPPHVIIQSARYVPQESSSNSWENSTILDDGVTLSHSQNHLAIWFRGVDLKSPDGMSYRYKLRGLDSAYAAPVKNDVVDYPSLPSGSYTFEVKAMAADGTPSANIATFSFSITPPFYQTAWFRIAGIVFFILCGIGLQNYRHRIALKRQKAIEGVKREESLRIRQQTAEDFHDELGNKLTRITVLSEILDTKMDQQQVDQKKLLEQIKQNASSLYNGTKDILWALDPQSDNLYEILNHIKDFGNELFLDTTVEFEFSGIDESLNEIKLPMEYSRNIPMIFKELLNNILKHAHSTRVGIELAEITRDDISLVLQDNGCGFDRGEIRKGQGINNIAMRTKRIGGEITINSEKGKGTLVELRIKINHAIIH